MSDAMDETYQTVTAGKFSFAEMADVGPTGVRSGRYWVVFEKGVKLGRRFHDLDTAKSYARGRS
jgi:hypothetical protein